MYRRQAWPPDRGQSSSDGSGHCDSIGQWLLHWSTSSSSRSGGGRTSFAESQRRECHRALSCCGDTPLTFSLIALYLSVALKTRSFETISMECDTNARGTLWLTDAAASGRTIHYYRCLTVSLPANPGTFPTSRWKLNLLARDPIWTRGIQLILRLCGPANAISA